MKELKEIALNFILENIDHSGKLTTATHYSDYYEVLSALIEIGDLENSKKILIYLSKFQTWRGVFEFEKLVEDNGKYNSILFLNLLSKYLIKSNNVDEFKFFKKVLKKSINSLRDYFDEDYLLFFRRGWNLRKEFHFKENLYFLSLSSGFSDFLNQYDFNDLADELFMLKGKIELGFERYFFQDEVLIQYFVPEEEYFQGYLDFEVRRHYVEYPFLNNSTQKIISSEIKESDFELHFFYRLYHYLFLKKTNGEYKKYLKKDMKFLVEIPTTLVPKDYIGKIEKSLFHKDVNIIKTSNKKYNLLVRDIYRLKIAALILRLID